MIIPLFFKVAIFSRKITQNLRKVTQIAQIITLTPGPSKRRSLPNRRRKRRRGCARRRPRRRPRRPRRRGRGWRRPRRRGRP
jgi:hypothetical protein